MRQSRRLASGICTLGVTPPSDSTDRLEVRRFFRDISARMTIVGALLLTLALVVHAKTWILVSGGLGLIVCALGLTWFTSTLRRDRDRAR